MPGTTCLGHTESTVIARDERSYEDGVNYRFQGTALERPKTDNPHTATTPEAVQWDLGWDHADAGTVRACSCYQGQQAAA